MEDDIDYLVRCEFGNLNRLRDGNSVDRATHAEGIRKKERLKKLDSSELAELVAQAKSLENQERLWRLAKQAKATEPEWYLSLNKFMVMCGRCCG